LQEVSENDHLHKGDLFSIYGLNGENVHKITKVVKLEPDVVHIFVYDKVYSERPSASALGKDELLPAWLDAQHSRQMYYPVSRKLFSLMRPVFLANKPVEDIELNGYRQWCLTGYGHVIGSHISLDDEIDNNLRVYSKIFFSFSTPTFIAFTFYMLAYGLVEWLPFALLFGAIFGGIMVILQWASIRRQRQDTLRRISASSIQFHEIEMVVPFERAFEQGVRALSTINNCKPVAVDLRGGTIEGRVPKTLVEGGQEILMVFSKNGADSTTCVVWSESTAGVTADLGKNLGNVNAIISYLKSSTPSKEPFSVDVGDNMATEPDGENA